MTKLIVSKIVDTYSPYELHGTALSVLGFVTSLIEKYGETVRLEYEPNHYELYDRDPSPRFVVKISQEETDEEYETRINQENLYKAQRIERDRVEFERLKKQFGE